MLRHFLPLLALSSTFTSAIPLNMTITAGHDNNMDQPFGGQGQHDPLALGTAVKQTNAERIAKGLGPMPPTRRATGMKPRRSAIASDSDFTNAGTKKYTIHVIDPSNGSGLGVLAPPDEGAFGQNPNDSIDFNPDSGRALHFSSGSVKDMSDPSGGPFEMIPDGGQVFGRPSMLAALGHGSGCELVPGSQDFAHLGMSRQDPTGLLTLTLPLSLLDIRPTSLFSTHSLRLDSAMPDLPEGGESGDGSDDGVSGPAQSAIWILEPNSRRLSARYLNKNGQTSPTQFFTGGPCQHTICLTADIKATQDYWGGDAKEVYLVAGLL